MATAHERGASTTFTRFLPGQAFTGGVDWDWRLKKRYAVQGYWAGSTRARQRRGDRRAAGEHRPQLPAARRGSRRGTTRRARRSTATAGRSRSARSAGRRSASTRTSATRAPASTSTTSASCAAPTMRTMSNWLQWRNDTPSKYLRSFRFNLNQWAGVELRRRSARPRRQRQRALGVREQLEHRHGLQRRTRAPFDDRATRGGARARYGNPQLELSGATSTRDERKPVDARQLLQPRRRRPRHALARRQPRRHVSGRRRSSSLSGGLDWNHNVQDAQWVENTADGRYVFGRLDQTTVSLTTARELHDHAAACRSRSTPRRSSRPATTSTSSSWSTAAPRATRIATRRSPTPATPTSTTARSAPPTCCAGSTSPARRCSSSGSRAARTCSTAAVPLRPRLRRRLRRPGAQRVPREVELLDQPLTVASAGPTSSASRVSEGHESEIVSRSCDSSRSCSDAPIASVSVLDSVARAARDRLRP